MIVFPFSNFVGLDKEVLLKFILQPEAALWNGTLAELQLRFPYLGNEDLALLNSEMQRENDFVRKLMADLGLASWAKGIYSDAQQAIGDEISYGDVHDHEMKDQAQGKEEDAVMD